MKYDVNYHPQSFIDLSNEGLSNLQIAAKWNLSVRTIQLWAKDDKKPEFKEAFILGQQREEAIWEALGWKLANGEVKGNGIVYIYSMKARFGGKWLNDGKHNTLDITTKHQNMTDAEINQIIKGYLAKETFQELPEVIDLAPSDYQTTDLAVKSE